MKATINVQQVLRRVKPF